MSQKKEVDKNDYYKSTDKETNGNDKNYGRSPELYSKQLLKQPRRQHFVTIPHSDQDHQQLLDNIEKASKNIKYLCVAKEKHTEGGEHYHILITATRSINVSQIHKRIMETEGNIKGSINYQQVKSLQATETYIKKDGNYKECGELSTQKYKKDKQSIIDETLNEAYTNDKTFKENIELIKAKQPAYFTQYKNQIINELKLKDEKELLKFEAPVYTSENTQLRPYQKRIWELINTQPKVRRIIWVNGRPNTGKSFMFNYIEENFKYGIYSAGSTASLDNAVYGYEEQGAIAWDIPLNYDYKTFGDALASTIEKFSDFGQHLTSRKYQGKKIQVLGHVLVFANRPVLPQLKHRDIIEINPRDDLNEEEKLATWNIEKKLNSHGITIYQETIYQSGEDDIRKYYHSIYDLPEEIRADVYDI